ncbi:hypothetical protein L195_g047626 [Trifolium pratense]|uniref:Uncharacterized protein n=1 Tax=Trifolium pratense TaxID=57577 RepID=A0A2K3ML50_TRIPR|nr:hypothetical protein L195_g047626 [Trifolium pratense]
MDLGATIFKPILFQQSGHSWGAIQVDVAIGSSVRPTLILVVPSKANYNLLLGREWIHGVGVVPSTLHQRLTIWREDGVVENIEADQTPCGENNAAYEDPLSDSEVYHSVKLHPTHGFMWKREVIDPRASDDGEAPSPGGWDDMFLP